jgi:hypothetical protein
VEKRPQRREKAPEINPIEKGPIKSIPFVGIENKPRRAK